MSTLSMNQDDHPAHNLPDATQQYAGDVLPLPIKGPSLPFGDPQSVGYAVGSKSDDKVKSIGMDTLKDWATRMGQRKD